MTREEAIKMFKSMIEGKSQLNACGIDSKYDFRCGESFFKALEMAIKALEQEPKIPHWNHGLPDTGDEYIVTVRERWGKDEEWKYESVGAYYTTSGWELSYDIDEGQEWEIIAWMPLPKPYKSESEDKGWGK